MDEQIRQALANEILSQLNGLSNLEPGSKEQQTAVENVTKLYRLGLEDVKADTDYDEKLYRRDVDAQHEQDELDRQAREELPLIFYATWMKRGFKFEETGTYTSTTFRGLFNRFRPTKK